MLPSFGWYIWHTFGKCLSHNYRLDKQMQNIWPQLLFKLVEHPSDDTDWNITCLWGEVPSHPRPQAASTSTQPDHSPNSPPNQPKRTAKWGSSALECNRAGTGISQNPTKPPTPDVIPEQRAADHWDLLIMCCSFSLFVQANKSSVTYKMLRLPALIC